MAASHPFFRGGFRPFFFGGAAWALIALLTVSGIVSVIAVGRFGVRIFWADEWIAPRVRLIEIAPVAGLLALCLALTVTAGPTMRYLQDAAQALYSPQSYIHSVLGSR